MKVGQVNNLYFKSKSSNINDAPISPEKKHEIKELSYVTPDFTVNLPQKYSKIDTKTLPNGLELHCYKLANGHRVTIVPMEGSPAVVKNYVNVGSMNETPEIKGISHFLEHMAFNGTNGENGHVKLNVGDSFKKIDELGGWANASTNYAVTDYVNSTPQLEDSDVEKQIQIIAAMTEDLKLSDEMIEKEKGPVCSEINMILDDPQTVALDQTVRTLFGVKNPADELVGGSVKHIKNLTRKDVMDYYNKYYTPDNMNLVITGDVNPDEVIKIVSKNFNSKKVSQGRKYEEKLSPINQTVRKDFVSNKATSAQIVLGFAGPKNNDAREKLVFSIAKNYIDSSLTDFRSALKELNSYPYISNEKISTNPSANQFVYIGTTSSEENSEKVLNKIFKSVSNIKPASEENISEIKNALINSAERNLEYSSVVNDCVGNSVLNNTLDSFVNEKEIIQSISAEEVNNAINKYFDLSKTAITVVHPKTDKLSFKGKAKSPVNMEKVERMTLPNNFDIGFYETKSNNTAYNAEFITDVPYNKKAGVVGVLNTIYTMGTAKHSEKELNRFMEKNDIDMGVSVGKTGIKFYADSGLDKQNLVFEKIKEYIYNPAITEENLEIAKSRIKDSLNRSKNDAYDLYLDYSAENDPYSFTVEELKRTIDSITLEDVKDCHKYFLENSRGIVTANLPEKYKNEVKQKIIKHTSELMEVKPNNKRNIKIFTPNDKSKVLTEANNNSQADIMQVFRFKASDDVKDVVCARVANSILSNNLFNTLREKEHLAYSVKSSIERNQDIGELSCNILTTTDNKKIGEISYDNVQKSIDGFNARIDELKSGEFTDEDLKNAKLALKAELLQNEGVEAKLSNLTSGMDSKHGIDYRNKLFEAIDKIDKNDVVNFAVNVFSSKPIYSITASQDTLDYNKNYFAGLEA